MHDAPPPVTSSQSGERLVTRQLEADWEAALAEAGRLEADCQRFTEEHRHLATASGCHPGPGRRPSRVWRAPSTTQATEGTARILIQDITVTSRGSESST